MPRGKIYTDEELKERIKASKARWRQRNRERLNAYQNEYYNSHKDKFREYNSTSIIRIPLATEKPLRETVLEWNGQLTKKLEENPPQWLEIALNDQIRINQELLEKIEAKEEKKQDNEKPIKWVYAYKLDTNEFIGRFKKQIDASRFFGFPNSKVGYIMNQQGGKFFSKNLYFTYTPLINERTEPIHNLQ